MKLIQQTHESEPYVVKAKYTGETKATYFNSKNELLDDKQTQFLSYCIANNYQNIFHFMKDPFVKAFIDTLTEEQKDALRQQLDIYNYGSTLMLPKSLEISRGVNTFEAQVNKDDIKNLLFNACTNLHTFDELDDFQDQLPFMFYADYSDIAMIDYTINNQNKTYQFVKDGYFINENVYNIIKNILQKENVTLIKRIDADNENRTLTLTSHDNQIITIDFKQIEVKE